MGCTVVKNQDCVEVTGSKLRGIEIDMNKIPDCVPTLAVLAAFAEGPTTITNVEHLRYKESNRLSTLSLELTKIGASVETFADGLTIRPQPLHGALIETYNDHRIAMSFAIAGLCIEGIAIRNPACVSKSFPNFWQEFEKIEGKK
jgi:3-phosphoshikimate 1-carboxyvinyltransferase